MADPGKFLLIRDVIDRTGLCRSEIYKRMKENRFPAAVPLATKKVVWVESEVIQWQIQQIERARG